MTNLAVLINTMPPPELPDSFSAQDCQTILLALEFAKQQARPYDGDYQATWLLNSFLDQVWITINRGREEIVKGDWKNAVRIDWRVRLPNGAMLTDARYERLLNANKRIAFLARSGFVCGMTAPGTWKRLVAELLQLTRWMVLHQDRYLPESYGFGLLDQPALDSLFGLLSEGGWAVAHQVPQRLLAVLHQSAFSKPCPRELLVNPYAIPRPMATAIADWLEQQGFYGEVPRGAYYQKRYLKRAPMASLIGEPVESIRISSKIAAFFRQFEPELQYGNLLVQVYQMTEMPDQKTRAIHEWVESGAAENSLLSSATNITTILSAHRHDPDNLPAPGLVSVRRAQNLSLRETRLSSHNLFMPVNVGLTYLNEAIRFIHIYGDAIVGHYLAVESSRTPESTQESLDAAVQSLAGDWCVASGEPVAHLLNISGFVRDQAKPDFERFRSCPTLGETLRVLIGACIVSIALLKPSREGELTHLKRGCLSENGSGYSLNFSLGKSNTGEAYQHASRPIPVITARAIHLLQRLGSGLADLFNDDRKTASNLFYLPKLDGAPGALAADGKLLNMHLDALCDFVGLPPDKHGRRWYVRVHEMRKWFLLLLFWSGRYDVLDAARWIAGHTNVLHIYAYIEREFPGEELPKLEAEYSVERLRALEAHGNDLPSAGEFGLDQLYEVVLRHFNVNSLSMVPESDWVDYVTTLREAGGFVLEPHSVYSDTGADVIGINVSFVLRDDVK